MDERTSVLRNLTVSVSLAMVLVACGATLPKLITKPDTRQDEPVFTAAVSGNTVSVKVEQPSECRTETLTARRVPGRSDNWLTRVSATEWAPCGSQPIANAAIELDVSGLTLTGTTNDKGEASFDVSGISALSSQLPPRAAIVWIETFDRDRTYDGAELSDKPAHRRKHQTRVSLTDTPAFADWQKGAPERDAQKAEELRRKEQATTLDQAEAALPTLGPPWSAAQREAFARISEGVNAIAPDQLDDRQRARLKAVQARLDVLRPSFAKAQATADAEMQRIADAPSVRVQDILLSPQRYANGIVKVPFMQGSRYNVQGGYFWDFPNGSFADRILVLLASDAGERAKSEWLTMGSEGDWIVQDVLGVVRVNGKGEPILLLAGIGTVVHK